MIANTILSLKNIKIFIIKYFVYLIIYKNIEVYLQFN